MKNKVLCMLFVMTTIFLTGCNNTKQMTCVQNSDIMSTQIITVFKNDKLDSMKVIYSYDISEYSDDNKAEIVKQDFCKILENSNNDYKGSFLDCNQDIKDNSLIVTANMDVNEQKKNGVNSYDNLKKELINSGAKCDDY